MWEEIFSYCHAFVFSFFPTCAFAPCIPETCPSCILLMSLDRVKQARYQKQSQCPLSVLYPEIKIPPCAGVYLQEARFWAWDAQGTKLTVKDPRDTRLQSRSFIVGCSIILSFFTFCCWWPFAVLKSSQSCLTPAVNWNGFAYTKKTLGSVWMSRICWLRSQKALCSQWIVIISNHVFSLLENISLVGRYVF